MDFELDAEALALLEAAGAMLDAEATPALIRAAWPASRGDAPATAGLEQVRKVWATLADLGAVGALVAEDAGGLGLDLGQVVPLLERVGYVGLPVPAVETIVHAAPLLAAAGHPALPDVLAGRALVAVGTVTAGGDTLIPYGRHADLVVLPGLGLRAFGAGELALEPVATVDGARALARLAAPPAPGTGTLLTADPAETEAAWWRAAVGTGAVLVGLAARMLALTVEYTRNRAQFGVPVGSFQAVKHALAGAHLAVEFARPAVLAAGWRAAHSPEAAETGTTTEAGTATATDTARDAAVGDARDAASVAKVLAGDAARLAARASIQCHGAIGYTTEYDLHLFAKPAWALIAAFGDPHWHRARLAASLGLPDPVDA
ncbi:acyl-CoA dehydrogenase family protein [Frankia sp. CNm7]|uniref:Acyl-CoA dehydrogenase family protein n=1 Tax=Frankia nepalensis TaxID=1836974 RepID=A0A937RNK7_9ACTN|nr:acyl-CoA dehydrogenase [Frankia nepalensis]MBL7502169.1 acyl-CoA dehydrogenase family protein [Frankia nepalensis]MBL7510565.1 acyl-CoA dehydrogenase family protein [Frankia nepalensis]MBL7522139.1 acyl-CoA dehydrogenase family protein [Frankia nepalensis]MBL7633352.1 acyl-CoA dehydrogenase family protein [Frankia nepalensis]